jgi:hypothetical protein
MSGNPGQANATSPQRGGSSRGRSPTTATRARSPPTSPTPLLGVLDELIAQAANVTEQYANNRIEADHGRLTATLRPLRSLKTPPGAPIMVRGHAIIQNLRPGHYQLGIEARHPTLRLPAAFDQLAPTV